MIPSIEFLNQKYAEFNTLYFDSCLPQIPITLSNAKTFIGQLSFKVKRGIFGKKTLYDFKIKINKRADLPVAEVEDTLIHEMIHYYIAYKGIKDSSAHGKEFKAIMNNINDKHDRHITISHKSSKEQRQQLAGTKPRIHIVAVMERKNGKAAIKCLPRNQQKITRYYNVLMTCDDIVAIELYQTDDIFFNQYPTSSAFNYFPIDREELMKHIEGAKRLR